MRHIIFIIVAVFISGCSIDLTDKELLFVGKASHYDAQIALEHAKQEAIEKLLFAAGITVEGKMTDTIDYAKVFSSSVPKEKGQIKFSKQIVVIHSFLKDLNLQMETQVIQNNKIYTGIVTLKTNRRALIRAKKAGARVQQEVKKKAKRGLKTVFWAKTWKLVKCLTFGILALVIITGTLYIGKLKALLNWEQGIHPAGLLLIALSTALLIFLSQLFFGKIPHFIMELIGG